MEVQGLAKNTLQGRIPAFVYGVFKHTGRRCVTAATDKYSILGLLSRNIARMADDVKRKFPVGEAALVRMFSHLREILPAQLSIQLWAWWTVAYSALLRSAETVGIMWKDVSFGHFVHGTPHRMRIVLRASGSQVFKTHTNSVELAFAKVLGKKICPIQALWSWRSACMAMYGGLHEQVFELTVDGVRQAFQVVATAALGGSNADYGLHSLRAGGATDAEEKGYSLSEIMFLGRWRSPAVLVYLSQGERWAQELRLGNKQGTMSRPTLDR